MERIGVGIISGLITLGSVAQNLVPNGSFEEYTTCPEFFGYAQYATGWLNLHTISADYFNRCQENLVVGVPFNTCGYQEPADGNAYMGMATTLPGLDWYREIVGIELAEPLQVGVQVCLSFKMAVGGFGSWAGNSAMFTSKGVGMHFFNDFPTDWPTYLYPNTAALSMEIVPTDTAIWYVVSGEYTPDSNYTHLAIGNFFADSISSIIPLDTSGFGSAGDSYAFIDDVRVSYELEFCGITGIPLVKSPRMARLYPNPVMERFTVALLEPADDMLRWELLNLFGQQLLMGSIGSGTLSFVVTVKDLPQGAYVLRLHANTDAYSSVHLVSVSP